MTSPTFVPRGRHLFVYDLGAILVAIVGAFALRFDAGDPIGALRPYLPVVLLPLVVQPLVNVAFGLYRREWRYASVREMFGVVGAVASGTVICAVLFLIFSEVDAPGASGMPRSFFPLEAMIAVLLIGGGRFTLRWLLENSGRSGGTDEEAKGPRTLVYGAGQAGAAIARIAERDHSTGIVVVGYLDDDPSKRGSMLLGRRIFGDLNRIAEAVRRTRASQLLVAMPSAPGSVVRAAVDRAQRMDLSVRIVPPLDDLLGHASQIHHVRPVQLDDLLRREPIHTDVEELAGYLNGASVVVTGGAGSIGGELARQIVALGPRSLTILDHSEFAVWAIERELRERGGVDGAVISTDLCDVRSPLAVEHAIRRADPDVVFHAAALKHVPICEAQPSEAVMTNVIGTHNVLRACEQVGVGRFVLISSDKAVTPVSIMGATKRLAELLTVAAAERCHAPYTAVRFGNVLGSSGSVVALFQRQIEQGLALTITHPDATRYFMTIPEAVTLILQAGSDSIAGQVYILDMGDPVKIVDLAADMVRLSGLETDTVAMNFVGLRPGERLHETLFFDNETVEETTHRRVWRTKTARVTIHRPLDELVADLERAALRVDDQAIRTILVTSGALASADGPIVAEGLTAAT
jgi:FlaA1/EpsC-like NDP-sugar epimerase